jgi:hypothetical protein
VVQPIAEALQFLDEGITFNPDGDGIRHVP